MFTSFIQLYSDYRKDVNSLSQDIKKIKQVHVSSIIENVWIYSESLVKTQLISMVGLPGIEHLAIIKKGEILWQAGRLPKNSYFVTTYPLVKDFAGSKQLLGTLHITATHRAIYQSLLEKAGLILLTNAIKTFLVAGFILFIVYNLVTRHINSLAKFIHENDIHQLKRTFKFDRRIRTDKQADELDDLLSSYNNMCLNLDTAIEKRIEFEKEAQLSQLANQQKSKFLANMSHELRTPLNAIIGFSSLLVQQSEAPAKYKEKLNIINSSSNHLLSLINNVLDMSKIEAGHIDLKFIPTNIPGLINAILEMLSPLANDKGLTLSLIDNTASSLLLNVDAEKLRQILINLVGNGIKNTEEGYIAVHLYSEPVNANEVKIRVEVEDTGYGISESNQLVIFQPFEQVDQKASIHGTGLGLALSKQYIELMGGTLSVQSELELGSTFTINLQLEISKSNLIKDEIETTKQVIAIKEPVEDWRFLIVEDNDNNRLLLQSILQNIGLTAKEATNGQEAIDIIKQWQPHLIWMDTNMPIMDGLEATQIILELPNSNDIVIVALTSEVFDEHIVAAKGDGFNDIITKPFLSSDIYSCLEKYLDIEFIYSHVPSSESKPQSPLSKEMLKALPHDMVTQLNQAAHNLDLQEAYKILELIEVNYPEIASAITQILKHYDFVKINNMINSINNENNQEEQL